MQQEGKVAFTSKIGLVMAAVGSAVGLGNIWKFPYVAGENGGGAFLLIYLVCVLLFGMPMVMAEFIIGKHSGKSIYESFRAVSRNNHWQWLGWMCLLATTLVMGFYFVVTGWCFRYMVDALTGSLAGAKDMAAHFHHLITNAPQMFAYCMTAIGLTAGVLWFDVNKGIERLSKILMPLLIFMMLLMVVRVLMLPGSNVGIRFLFDADFSKITPHVILSAMGQCLFSLSIGFGAMITYGAYMPKRQNIVTSSLHVVVLDTLVAILAGMIIFPTVFAFGLDPAEGPELVFVALPSVFDQMSFSRLSALMFFSLLCIAAITSMISMMEVMIAFITDATSQTKHPLNRHQAVLISTAVCVVISTLCILSYSGEWSFLTIGGKNMFDALDLIASNILLPINALAIAVFVGWFIPKDTVRQELYSRHTNWRGMIGSAFILIIRFFVPIAIVAVFINELFGGL